MSQVTLLSQVSPYGISFHGFLTKSHSSVKLIQIKPKATCFLFVGLRDHQKMGRVVGKK
jgi:hypothetical protein